MSFPGSRGKAICKAVMSGDTIIIRGNPTNGPPPEGILQLSMINSPRLVNGDVANIQHGEEPRESDQVAFEQFTAIMKDFQSNPSFKGAQVVYLPGNHDPKELFEEADGVKDALNLHLKSTFLESRSISAPGLLVLGLGGSVPGIYRDSQEVAFPGFPFKDDDQVKGHLATLYSQSKQKIDESKSYILLTHNGPFTSPTTWKRLDGKQVLMGSKALLEKMDEQAEQILLHIHGHSHEGWGVARLPSGVMVVNPGALKDGRFGMVEIEEKENGKFRVASIQLHSLF